MQYGDVEPVVANGQRMHEFLQEMHQAVMTKHDLVTVGETPGATTDDAKKYANLEQTELNMVFEFEHVGLDGNDNPALGKWSDKKVSLPELRDNLVKWQTQLSGKAWNSLYWNNHDQPRVVSRFGNDDPKYRVVSAKMLATMLHCLQGTPYIYAGEELGMTNTTFNSLSDYRDLESINAYHQLVDEEHLVDGKTMSRYLAIHSRDNARTPMQWDDSKNAGFSDAEPWIAVNPNYSEINARAALADPSSVFYHYQKLIQMRHDLPVMTEGKFALVKGNESDDQVFAYTRDDGETTLLVVANFTKETIMREYAAGQGKLLLSNYEDDQGKTLRPYEAKVYEFSSKGE
jgi:oligo-1,6-glucosidase